MVSESFRRTTGEPELSSAGLLIRSAPWGTAATGLTYTVSRLDGAQHQGRVPEIIGSHIGQNLAVTRAKLLHEPPGDAIDGIGKCFERNGSVAVLIGYGRDGILGVDGLGRDGGIMIDDLRDQLGPWIEPRGVCGGHDERDNERVVNSGLGDKREISLNRKPCSL